MQRRNFLRGLGGAAVAAPFLSSLSESAAQPPVDPRRLIVMFTHYGCLTDRWFPANSHGALGEADYEATSLEPIKGFADKLLMPRGIRGINEWSFAREFGQETDPYSQAMGSFFTAYPVDRTSSGFDIGGGLDFEKLNAQPYGRSMDHYIADQINPAGVGPLVVHLGGAQLDSSSTLSYSAPLTKYSGVGTPAELFAGLTNLGATTALSEDEYRVARGQSVIDLVRADLDQLQSHQMSQADRYKLEQWKDLLHETTANVRPSLCTEATAGALGISPETVGAPEPELTLVPERARLMMDLAVLAALCDESRVIVLQFPSNARFDFLGYSDLLDHRGYSQRTNANGAVCLTDNNEILEAVDRFHAEQFAHLLGRLDSFEESTGTLLDNSATVWMMAHSDGSAHNNNNLPILHAGSCGGYFKTGMAVNVEDGRSDLTPGHSSEMCQDIAGSSHDVDPGTPNDLANAPINKYLYNLMNAVGVKANADGFPDPTGTEPVQRFGWSDNPQTYATFIPIDGIENQPGDFVDPGEFSDLRA